MLTAHLSLDPGAAIAPVPRRLFGSFVEHLGRCVYTGLYEPAHPSATPEGFRGDVLDLVRQLGVTTVRYPGGNFVSGYRWEDGVGPVRDRPARLDLAWHSTEPNTFGVDEFMAWAKAAGLEPMMAVNLGTRGIQEALDLLEYCNHAGGTALSDRRRANGSVAPYGVRMWCLGNEMDGPWQIGGMSAPEYARLASRTAKAMKMIDPSLELVACGSSSASMPTFGAWEREVLEQAYDDVDFLSAHAYYWPDDGDLASFLASAVNMDYFIESVIATADHVKAAQKKTKTINISFDEWNVWYLGREPSTPPKGADWPIAPNLLEDRYDVADAVVVGSLMISLLRHCDRVQSACLAQLVNVIAPIMTEPGGAAWCQTTFHPFALTARYASGQALRLSLRSPRMATGKYGEVEVVDAVATTEEATGATTVFVVNRSPAEAVRLGLDVAALGPVLVAEATTVAHPGYQWIATAADSTSIGPRALAGVELADGVLRCELAPMSWSMLRLGQTPVDRVGALGQERVVGAAEGPRAEEPA